MKSIFNDLELLEKFNKIINLKFAQQAITLDQIQRGIDELVSNLTSQYEFATEKEDAPKTLDVFTQLRDLESFVRYLFENKTKYKGIDIVDTSNKGVAPEGFALSKDKYEELYQKLKAEGRVRYERENAWNVHAAGIWAWIKNLKKQAEATNKNAVPAVNNIIEQLKKVIPDPSAGAGTDIQTTPPGAGDATTVQPPTGQQPAGGAPGTAGTGAGSSGMTQDQQNALNALRAIAANGGPLHYGRIQFQEIKYFLINCQTLFSSQYDTAEALQSFTTNQDKYYNKLSRTTLTIQGGNEDQVAEALYRKLGAGISAIIGVGDVLRGFSEGLTEDIRYVVALVNLLCNTYGTSYPEFKRSYYTNQNANGTQNTQYFFNVTPRIEQMYKIKL